MIEVGKKYLIRKWKWSDDPELMKVKIIKILKLGDGKIVIRYRYNWPFPITEDISWAEFKKSMARKELLTYNDKVHDDSI